MFIVQKGSNEYLYVEDTPRSLFYKYVKDIEYAAKFNSEESAKASLKKSGFFAHSGLKIIEVD